MWAFSHSTAGGAYDHLFVLFVVLGTDEGRISNIVLESFIVFGLLNFLFEHGFFILLLDGHQSDLFRNS